MIDGSHRGLFFTATALMCAVVFYGSELAKADSDELSRGASALPRQLTLPPGMKSEMPPELALQQTSLNLESCAEKASKASTCLNPTPQGRDVPLDIQQTPTPVKAELSSVTNLGAAAP